jgi:carbonic anhydrase
LTGKYSAFTIAGASIAVVAPAFKEWHKTFWENLAASVQLHHIKKVIVVNHRDCGAAKIAYGAEKVFGPLWWKPKPTRQRCSEFRRQLKENQPELGVEFGPDVAGRKSRAVQLNR